MSHVWRLLKGILLWSYGRTSWQYDVLCVLILAFVFLTPHSWFDAGSKPRAFGAHQKGLEAVPEKLLIMPADLGQNPDPAELNRRARLATNRAGARVKEARGVHDAEGRLVAYEVDLE